MRGTRIRQAVAAAVIAVVGPVSGCAVSLDKFPLPAPGMGDGSYSLHVTFENALNLPMKAKVKLDGADIGLVESMAVRDYTAVVDLQIRDDVRLPVGTRAELRSATPMGDVFVSMALPAQAPPGGALLQDGASIPIEDTSAAATIEQVLSRASLFVGGGAIEHLTHVVTALGEYTEGRGGRLADLLAHTRQLLTVLTQRSDAIRKVMADTADLTATVSAQQPAINDAINAAGPALGVVAENTQNIVGLVDRINTITQQLARFPSIQGTNNGSMIEDINKLAAGLNAAVLNPDADISITTNNLPILLKVLDAGSAHVSADVAQVAIGAVPDPNFPGDPGARLPEAGDWHAFVGSLSYMLQRLGSRAQGLPGVPELPRQPGIPPIPGAPPTIDPPVIPPGEVAPR